VTPVTPAVQEIAREGQAIWTWGVEAEQSGPKTLTVTTVVEAKVNGRVYELKQTQRERTLTVGVPFMRRARDTLEALPGWLKLLTGVLTALAALATAWWVLRNAVRGHSAASNKKDGA